MVGSKGLKTTGLPSGSYACCYKESAFSFRRACALEAGQEPLISSKRKKPLGKPVALLNLELLYRFNYPPASENDRRSIEQHVSLACARLHQQSGNEYLPRFAL